MKRGLVAAAIMASSMQSVGHADNLPKMIAYSARPNAYFNQRAAEIARLYDGFFFTIGSWDEGVIANLGLGDAPATTDWKEQARENLVHLRQAGVTENLLGVHFAQDAPWPSAATLLSADYTARMARHFAAVGKAAKELGFRGVSIDVEYPYPRYSLDHETYTYDGYTAEDLLAAASAQGQAVMSAVLDEFPEAVVFVLPGDIWGRPLERAFMLAMLQVMAERDAPGGYHLGFERAYCLYEPQLVSQVAIPRVGDCAVEVLADAATRDYWKRRCSVAPGVWPLHMVETGGEGYPVQPWADELAELERQLAILRRVARRYVWSFSGQPIWYQHTPELEAEFGLQKQTFDGADEAIPGWHRILASKRKNTDRRIANLVEAVESFDRGEMDSARLCDRFGTPGDWLILGPLGNPYTHPAYSAPGALHRPIRLEGPIQGRDSVVRWFVFRNREPLGAVRLQAAFDWRSTDHSSAHAVATIRSERQVKAHLWLNWDDGIAVWIAGRLVFDHRTYPPQGHGLLYRDRYLFEEHAPVVIPKGESRLAVTCINQRGSWGFNLRLTDEGGFPLKGVTFSLPQQEE